MSWFNYLYIAVIASVLGLIFIYCMPKFLIKMIDKEVPIEFFLKRKDSIAITIDDAPYTDSSFKDILNVLRNTKIKVTFFVISSLVNSGNINLLIQAVKDGHQLANHGKTNSAHWKLSKRELIKEIRECQYIIESIYLDSNSTLPKNIYYRPGCGIWNQSMLDIQKENNMKIILGSVYPQDPIVSISYINYLYVWSKIQRGDILILHDRSWTPDTLKKLVTYFDTGFYDNTAFRTLEKCLM